MDDLPIKTVIFHSYVEAMNGCCSYRKAVGLTTRHANVDRYLYLDCVIWYYIDLKKNMDK